MSKGMSQVLWFILAFVIILILLGIGILILTEGKGFALDELGNLAEQITKVLQGE